MCGIVGIIGREPAAPRIIEALQKLENRGHASAGLATHDPEKGFNFYAKAEPASYAFRGNSCTGCAGTAGIGHTRYPTSGNENNLERNIQPVGEDDIWTASNGDLVNISSQRERLASEGLSFDSDVDAKVIQQTLRKHMHDQRISEARNSREYFERLCSAAGQMHLELNGAYSTVNVTEQGLIAFRDPRGIRPMCIAERKEAGEVVEYIIASETSAINYFGDYSNVREVRPGELIYIDRKKLRPRSKIIRKEREAFCFFEFNYFAMPDSVILGKSVELARHRLGEKAIAEYAEKHGDPKERLDCLFGIPNTAISAAAAACNACSMPIVYPVLRRVGLGPAIRTYLEMSQARRKKKLRDKFIYIKELIFGRRLGSMDDSNMRGNTARAHNINLGRLGAADITNIFFTPPVIYPCFYGQDFQSGDELIAARCSSDLDRIAEEMEADEVFYISVEGMLEALGIPRERLCLACLTGEYPTDVSEAVQRTQLRIKEREEPGSISAPS